MSGLKYLTKLTSLPSTWIPARKLVSKGSSSKGLKSYKEIPGPRGLPFIGNVHRFLPVIGQLDNNNLHNLMLQLNKYGDIVKLDGIPFKKPLVFLFTAELAQQMYKQEGIWPRREAIDCMQFYFDIKKERHGLGVRQGEEWREFRTKVNQTVARTSSVNVFNEKIETVTDDFIRKMYFIRNPISMEMPADFINELNKWALEAICFITLDCRLGCLEKNVKNDEVQKMINSTDKMFELMFELENSILWKLFGKTPKLKRLFNAMDTVTGTAERYVGRAVERLKAKTDYSNLSMLEELLQRTDEATAVTMVQDLISGGVDTVGNTVGKALHAISTHPEVQHRLFLELQTVLPAVDSKFTRESLQNKVPYLKAVLKETMRLFPSVPGNMRTTTSKTILGEFMIPEGVNVFMTHSLMCKRQEYFEAPDRFYPERWLRDDTRNTSVREASYAFQPFGYGTRSCVARYLATNEMLIFIGKVVRKFQLEWNYDPLEIRHHLINTIASPLKIKVTDRNT